MQDVFSRLNDSFAALTEWTGWFWTFPCNLELWTRIPVLGRFPLALLLLLGGGLWMTLRLGAVQVRHFGAGVRLLGSRSRQEVGLSPLAAFLLSSATRIGPGNIMGVTGAIAAGGPGALFWMWVAAFFGMAMAFAEAVLAQLYKQRRGNEYVGGLPFYGRALLANRRWVGTGLALCYIVYALFTLPGQIFHMGTAFGTVAANARGATIARDSLFYYLLSGFTIVLVFHLTFGGVRRISRMADLLVPFMSILYLVLALILILSNAHLLGRFFTRVFSGAFSPQALFGGAIGVAVAQGVKRGLMSNEAGQGTITMSAAAAHARHPVEQGFIQSIGVFLDTMVICTITGCLVVMASVWNDPSVGFDGLRASKLAVYLASLDALTPDFLLRPVMLCMPLCYGLFAFTTIVGLISFTEISATQISRGTGFITFLRLFAAGLVVPFGWLCVVAGLELDNLWASSDLVNLLMVAVNVPVVLYGAPLVRRALLDYRLHGALERFKSERIGVRSDVWK